MSGRYEAYLDRVETELPMLSPEELKTLIDQNAVVILDVREPEEYACNHIPSAISIPRYRLEKRIEDSVAPDAKVVPYCGTRGRSTVVAASLKDIGWDVALLQGGLRGWVAAGLETKQGK